MKEKLDEMMANIYTVLVKNLFTMKTRMADRDQTIMLVFPYDNFEEYFTDNSKLFIVSFSDEDMFYGAIFRNYIKAQLQCITRNIEDRDMKFEFDDFIREMIDKNLQELKNIVHTRQPFLYRAIEQLHEHNTMQWHGEALEVAA